MPHCFTRLSDGPIAQVNHQAIILNEFLYVIGGFNSGLRRFSRQFHQIQVFKWNIQQSIWEIVDYPLKYTCWDCDTKSYTYDPLLSEDGFIHPTHRFGHSVVGWRGRGWLFGGRTQNGVCSSDVYMFDPASSHQERFYVMNASSTCSDQCVKAYPSRWGIVKGIVGTPPNPRDSHAAAVLENSMFIFGGFEEESASYDNNVYRLDFHTWSWTLIQTHPDPTVFDLSPGVVVGEDNEDGSPLPRDFASLISHHGRLFVFGGRSKDSASAIPGSDVYDSSLWELVPIHVGWSTVTNSWDPPTACSYCAVLISKSEKCDLLRMAWEEETGNWISSDDWSNCPPRPCGLYSSSTRAHIWPLHTNHRMPSTTICTSPWKSGKAVWRKVHNGHGLQRPDHLLSRLINPNCRNSRFLSNLSAPLGRRSSSHWAYDGCLYVALGTVRCPTTNPWQLHYDDIWRFNLDSHSWSFVHVNHAPWPIARRRAVACLHLPYPRYSNQYTRAKVFLFGGTQPCALIDSFSHSLQSGSLLGFSQSILSPYARWLSSLTSPDRITQNRLFRLDFETPIITLRRFPNYPNDPFSLFQPITLTYPLAVLLIDYPSLYNTSCVSFQLILILPPHHSGTPKIDLFSHSHSLVYSPLLSSLLVIHARDLISLFAASPCCTSCTNHLDHLFYNTSSDLERTQWYMGLQLAYQGLNLPNGNPADNNRTFVGGQWFELSVIQQQFPPVDTRTSALFNRIRLLDRKAFHRSTETFLIETITSTTDDYLYDAPTIQALRLTFDLLSNKNIVSPSYRHAITSSFIRLQTHSSWCFECDQVFTDTLNWTAVWIDHAALRASSHHNGDIASTHVQLQRFITHLQTKWLANKSSSSQEFCIQTPFLVDPVNPTSSTISMGPVNLHMDVIDHENSASSDSDDETMSTEMLHIEGVGALTKGNKKLVELGDLYVLHLDCSLYDLCLKTLRSSHPNMENSTCWKMLPDHIRFALKGMYRNSESTFPCDCQSVSG